MKPTFCLAHYRTGHIIRHRLLALLKERFKIFDEWSAYVEALRELELKNIENIKIMKEKKKGAKADAIIIPEPSFEGYVQLDPHKIVAEQSEKLMNQMVAGIVLNKDKTPIYDFECDHDADENYDPIENENIEL